MIGFLITAIAFLVIFSALVLIHEWGHFYAARRAGVKVEEFGFGLPPRIWGKKRGETLYSLNWIPFGGFVKLLGEDAHDPKVLKDKRSFASKRPRTRLLIIVAGVFMNFLLAWGLLTVGFTFGIQPLIVGPDDVLNGLANGSIKTSPGVLVKAVSDGSPLQVGDRLLLMNGRDIASYQQLIATESATFSVEREGSLLEITAGAQDFTPYELLYLPRVVMSDVKPESSSAEAGLQMGDIILELNDQQIYFMDEYEMAVRGQSQLTYTILRDNEVKNFEVTLPDSGTVVLSTIFPDSPAEKAGMLKGDIILSAQGETIRTPEQLVALTQAKRGEDLLYEIQRGGEVLELTVRPNEEGLVGVGLSIVQPFANDELSVYAGDAVESVLEISDVRYSVWLAPVKALEETGRLSVLTLDMFGNVLKQLVTQFSVPEGVAGPVGIAQLTYTFVQEGVLSLLRFMALLSLSLAIINILPFPALDGGRAFFILIEVLFGRRLGYRFEAVIHTVGFLVLMGLIFAVTYNDILRLF